MCRMVLRHRRCEPPTDATETCFYVYAPLYLPRVQVTIYDFQRNPQGVGFLEGPNQSPKRVVLATASWGAQHTTRVVRHTMTTAQSQMTCFVCWGCPLACIGAETRPVRHRTKPTSRSFIGKRAAGMELLRWIWPSSARFVRPTGTNFFFELETDATISQVNMTVPNKKVLNEILDINGDEGDTNMEEEMTEEHALHRA
jgi:hypothetical protein